MRNGLFIDKNKTKHWFKEYMYHRLDGPAYESIDNHKEWCKNGELHRLDGPAIEWSNGNKSWYYEGERIYVSSQEEFERYLNLKAFW